MKITCTVLSALLLGLLTSCGDDDGGSNNQGDAGGPSTHPDAATADAAIVEPTCANYCQAVTSTCTMTNHLQYADLAACTSACGSTGAGWTMGTANATMGNTIACRLYHAQAAADSTTSGARMTHCPHAGPAGGGQCGSFCDVYCEVMEKNCADTYTDLAACKTECATATTGGSPTVPTDGAGNATTGNSLQCRVNHAIMAGVTSAPNGPHCGHAALASDGQCVVTLRAAPRR